MKALSIQQPWAWLILHAGKDVENRTWPAPRSFEMPQRIAIHASLKMDEAAMLDWAKLRRGAALKPALDVDDALSAVPIPHTAKFVRGAIVGTVCVTTWTDGWAAGSPWYEGDYGLILSDPIAFPEPIPGRGALGLWEVSVEITARIYAAEAEAREAESEEKE